MKPPAQKALSAPAGGAHGKFPAHLLKRMGAHGRMWCGHSWVPATNDGARDHEPAAGGRKCSAGHQATEEQAPCCECEDVPLTPCLPHAEQPGPAGLAAAGGMEWNGRKALPGGCGNRLRTEAG